MLAVAAAVCDVCCEVFVGRSIAADATRRAVRGLREPTTWIALQTTGQSGPATATIRSNRGGVHWALLVAARLPGPNYVDPWLISGSGGWRAIRASNYSRLILRAHRMRTRAQPLALAGGRGLRLPLGAVDSHVPVTKDKAHCSENAPAVRSRW